MIGVTLGIGADWYKCAQNAARYMQRATGLDCHVVDRRLRTTDGVSPAWDKLWLQDAYPGEALLIFDSDIIAQQSWDPVRLLDSAPFAAVVTEPTTERMESGVTYECARAGLDRKRYVNTGLMLIRADCDVLIRAREFYPTCGPWYEQTAVNIALKSVDFAALPACYNVELYEKYFAPRQGVNLHYIGHWRNKPSWLLKIQRQYDSLLLGEARYQCISKR